ncbi:MAG: hypothetical protein A2X94_05860 [Bdellovibrionales bacterium GWB1_55_8]|nr:MAG: hypothetical protein A2X94_05860 [Bdellovibrionales bacterium GWB1_55_8]
MSDSPRDVQARVVPVNSAPKITMKFLIKTLIKYNASDLHLKAGRPPLYRINGKIVPVKMPDLLPDQISSIFFELLNPEQMKTLEKERQLNLSFLVEDTGRFRCNIYYHMGSIGAAIRMVPLVIPTFDSLGLPSVLKEFCQRPRGLVLVTGASGAGKSTTLAAMIQYVNENSHVHILSLDDPIEFVYRDEKALITQREIGTDVPNLTDALQAGLRQDPDVIVIGELLSKEMIQIALTAAETGHLVMATLHTNDATSALNRISEIFPPDGQQQIRVQLASSLVGVVSQQLLSRADGNGRVVACEVMVKSPVIEEYIRKNEINAIADAIANSNNHYKMQTMDQALSRLVQAGVVTMEEASKGSHSPDDLKLLVAGITRERGFEVMDRGQAA